MSRIPCSRCAKSFRTESGLRWHLLHIHDLRDIEDLLFEPAPSTLVNVALEREIVLAAQAKVLGCSIHNMRDLIGRHFPEYGSGRLPQGTTEHKTTPNADEVHRPPHNPVNIAEYWRNRGPLPPLPPGEQS